MKLREMVETLRMVQRVEIRNEDGYEICTCNTDSEGIKPYMNVPISEWFAGSPPLKNVDFVVCLKKED